MKNSENVILKISSIVFFLLISVAVILIGRNPSRGYELSIYSAISPMIWALLITAIIGGIAIVIHQVLKEDGERGNWWIVGLSLILLSSLAIVLLPLLRDYAFSSTGDHLSHLGWARDILQNGSIASNDVYPVIHILTSQFSSTLNISPVTIINFVGPLFYLLFVVSTYLLSKELLSKGTAILATTASTVFLTIYYIHIAPVGLSYMTFPLMLYLYFKFIKNKSFPFFGLGVSLVLLMVFFHPASSLTLTFTLLTMELSKIFLVKFYIGKSKRAHSFLYSTGRFSFSLPLISFVGTMLWWWNNPKLWEYALINIYEWLQGDLSTIPLAAIAKQGFGVLGLSILDQLILFFKMYGHIFIYLVISVIGILVILIRRVPSVVDVRITYIFSPFFLVVTALWLIDYLNPLTRLSSGRLVFLVITLFPPLVGLSLYQLGKMKQRYEEVTKKSLHQLHKNKLGRGIAIGAIITTCSLIGIFSIYYSPFIYQPNTQVTHMEVAGAVWLLEQGNPNVKVIAAGVAKPYRYAHALWGTQKKAYPKADENYFVGDHFKYDQYSTLGESLEGEKYMMSRSEFIKLLYSELYPQVGRFNMDDFSKLERDPSVNRLYANGEMDIFYVRGR